MNNLSTVLVSVDFSTGSLAALVQGARIARASKAKLHVLHVVDQAAVTALCDAHGSAYETQARISEEGASSALDRWLEQLGISASGGVSILIGKPLHEILEHARKLKADLLVAGITGTGDSPAGAGSVSGKLARKAGPRVLLVRSDHPHPFSKVVACIDFSQASREVAEQALRVALQDEAKVDFLHVWQDPWASLMYAVPFADAAVSLAPPAPEQLEVYVQGLRRDLHAFASEAAQGLPVTEVLHEGEGFGSGIAAYAQEVGADLIVLGGKGRSNLSYVLLGSTAERLLTRLPCSVLVVKPAHP